MTQTYRSGNVDVDAVALGIVKLLPAVDPFDEARVTNLERAAEAAKQGR